MGQEHDDPRAENGKLLVPEELPQDPRVLRMASFLGISPDQVLGALLRIWLWAARFQNSPTTTVEFLGEFVGVPEFGWAMKEADWLTPDGLVIVPTLSGRNVLNKHKRRKAPADSIYGEAPPIPPVLDTPDFRRAWGEWCAHLRRKRATLHAHSAVKQLAFLAKIGPAEAIRSVEYSIRNNYKGLFYPPAEKGSNGRQRSCRGQPGRVDAPPGKYDKVGIRVRVDEQGRPVDPPPEAGP